MTDQERNFYIHKNTGKIPSKPCKPSAHGSLYYCGKIIHERLPYGLLVHKKKQMIKDGYMPSKIEIHRYGN